MKRDLSAVAALDLKPRERFRVVVLGCELGVRVVRVTSLYKLRPGDRIRVELEVETDG